MLIFKGFRENLSLPRALWPRPAPCALPQVLVKGQPGARIKLEVSYQHSRKHLPIAVIRRAA